MKEKIKPYLAAIVLAGRRRRKTASTYLATEFHADENGIQLSGWLFYTRKLPGKEFRLDKFRDGRVRELFYAELPPRNLVEKVANKLCAILLNFRFRRFSLSMPINWAELPSSQYSFYATGNRLRYPSPIREQVFHPSSDRTVLIGCDRIFQQSLRAEVLSFGGAVFDKLSSEAQSATDDTARTKCLIGEYTISARDNGYALFNSITSGVLGNTEIDAQYVIERNNPDGIPIGRGIVEFGTEEHMRACLSTNVVAHAWDKRNVLPLIVDHIARHRFARIKSLFLQHGVLALKSGIEGNYHKDKDATDAFIVSSSREKLVVQERFGYAPEDIFITGLARHDELYEKARLSPVEPEGVLIFPTWRPYLVGSELAHVAASDWGQTMISLLHGLKRESIPSTLILHQIAAHTAPLFEGLVDEIRTVNEFQDTLIARKILITDYSSVALEATLIGRQTAFFTSKEISRQVRKAYISYPNELPGPAFVDAQHLALAIKSDEIDSPRNADLFFELRDGNACHRIVQVIRALHANAKPAARR